MENDVHRRELGIGGVESPPPPGGTAPASDEFFLARIAATLETISRSRWIFLVSNLVTMIIVGANLNIYGSWSRHLPERHVAQLRTRGTVATAVAPQTAPAAVPTTEDAATRGLQEFLRASVNHRFETLGFTVPILGLRLSTSDIGVVGSIAMLIVSMWLYYALRHEQHSVGRLVAEVSEPVADRDGRQRPGHFTIPPDLLERARQVAFSLSTRFLFITAEREDAVDESTPDDPSMRAPRAATAASTLLLWSPFWILIASAAIDLISLFWPSALHAEGRLWDNLPPKQQTEAVLRILFVGLAAAMVLPIVRRGIYYAQNTERVYRGLTRAIESRIGRRF